MHSAHVTAARGQVVPARRDERVNGRFSGLCALPNLPLLPSRLGLPVGNKGVVCNAPGGGGVVPAGRDERVNGRFSGLRSLPRVPLLPSGLGLPVGNKGAYQGRGHTAIHAPETRALIRVEAGWPSMIHLIMVKATGPSMLQKQWCLSGSRPLSHPCSRNRGACQG